MVEQYVCHVSDLTEKKPYVVKIGKLEVGVVLVKNEIYAFQNYCPHAGGPVCLGDVFGAVKVELREEDKSFVREYVSDEEFRLVCPWHGFEFDIQTNTCVTEPNLKIRSFETIIINEQVFVQIPANGGGE